MQNTPRLLLWTDAPGPYLDAIRAAGLTDQVSIDTLGRKQALSDGQLKETEVLMVANVPPGLLPAMPNLKWAQALTAGVEAWLALPDLPPALTLTCARGTHRESMPENILAALFTVTKPFAAIAEDQKRSHWGHRVATPPERQDTRHPGPGRNRPGGRPPRHRIGNARDRHQAPGNADAQSGGSHATEQTNQVLAQSDYVLLLLPATPATENFINAERLAHMKPGAWLLNFGRGHLIKDADLIAAVTDKKIAGAVLDVFRQEPLPSDHAFWTTPGIMVLPHIGGPHPDRDTIVARLFVENLQHYLKGQPLKEVVDRAAGY